MGIAGIDGNGQTELVEIITGLKKATKGTITINGVDIFNKPPRFDFINGVSSIPADRQKHGLVLDFSVEENLVLQNYREPQFSQKGMLNRESIREVENNKDLLIAVNPTRGLDVGAIEYVHKYIVEQRNKGSAVLLVSFELDEIMSLSDRIDVIYAGQIVDEVSGKEADENALGLMMAGGGKHA